MRCWIFAALGMAATFVCAAYAEDRPSLPDFATYIPSVTAEHVAQPPTIDGDLSDPIWQSANAITEFYQVTPSEGAYPSEQTKVYILYDEDQIYFGIHAYDSEPDKFNANVMTRDGQVFLGDFFGISIDSQNTGREAFVFLINAAGGRMDGIRQANGSPDFNWNTIWRARGKRVADGWTVEVSIPFRSLSFEKSADSWGLQLFRAIRRKNEFSRWANIDRSVPHSDVARAGRLMGLKDINQGLGLDVQVFGTTTHTRNWSRPGREDDVTFQPSGNVYYKLTPSLTGTLTFNTDFSDTALDSRQVNTTRFALFEPETRDFFLQDAPVFSFGGNPLESSNQKQRGGGDNGRPFFSRQIGNSSAGTVDILAGAKLSGSAGPLNVGVLTTYMDDFGPLESQTLSVVRTTIDVQEDSRLGFVYTQGDPTGLTENSVAGVDFKRKTPNFLGGGSLYFDGYYLQSSSDTPTDEDSSWGLQLQYPTDRLAVNFMFKEIGENFDPKIGFVNRAGIRRYDADFQRRWRPNTRIASINLESYNKVFTDLDDTIQSRQNRFGVEIENQVGDEVEFASKSFYERISAPFSLPRNLIIPTAQYRYIRHAGKIQLGNSRIFQASIWVECCDYFNGNRLDTKVWVKIQPNRFFAGRIEHEAIMIDLPTGQVDIHITEVDFDINFTPDMSVTTQIQYDNISNGLGISSRYRWEIRPETEIFIAFSHLALTNFDNRFESIQSGTTIRLGNTFRF